MTSMAKTVAIVQSNYIPWRGYFDLIRRADEFILFDSVQYTRRDWRNRNLIKTPSGTQWLTVPVQVKGRFLQSVDETQTTGAAWVAAHVRAIELNYRKAAAFNETAPWLLKELQAAAGMPSLSRLNERLIGAVAEKFAIATPIRRCTDLLDRAAMATMNATERLVSLCEAVGADRYLSGPAAKDYLDVAAFAATGITVEWMDYSGYPEYPQLWGAFEPRLSIIDLLLNTGNAAADFLNAQRE
jgi:hypothetical protein